MVSNYPFQERIKNAWNAFRNKDPIPGALTERDSSQFRDFSAGYYTSYNPYHHRFSPGVDKTLASAIYNRIALDAAQATFRHVRVDDNGTFMEEIHSGLNNALTREANVDQTGNAFIFDLILSMLDEGFVAAVPVDTTRNPYDTSSFDVLTLRTGKITSWFPSSVNVTVYNEATGRHEEIRLDKSFVAIIENPFYNVMNEPSSTLRRLTRKLSLLDSLDDDMASKKLDLIIQLPYVVKNDTKMKQADERRRQLEDQLERSKLGIGYIDGTERVIQLNRSLENNLMAQVEYLTSMLYSQLGLTAEIMNGTASETTMMNYYKRTIDVILQAVADEFERKFITKTGHTQGQAIRYYRDPFSLTPTTVIADIADKFTRNEILSPNEVRGIVGFRPSADEAANELRNRNISQAAGMETPPAMADDGQEGGYDDAQAPYEEYGSEDEQYE